MQDDDKCCGSANTALAQDEAVSQQGRCDASF